MEKEYVGSEVRLRNRAKTIAGLPLGSSDHCHWVRRTNGERRGGDGIVRGGRGGS